MTNYKTFLDGMEVSYSNEGVTKSHSYKNTTSLRERLIVVKNGDKDGSNFLRTTLKKDIANNLLPRSNANINEHAQLIILDCDKSILFDGAEVEGAPDPKTVHNILVNENIEHILYGTYSHYEGIKGNKYRILLSTNESYTKVQLPYIIEYLIRLINSHLDEPKLANAKENNVFAQSWYFPRKPQNSTVEHLYCEHLDGMTIDVRNINLASANITAIPSDKTKVKVYDTNPHSPIEQYNQNTCIKQLLKHYGYQGRGQNKLISPDSSSGMPGIKIKDNKFFSHHNDEFNDGYWHTPFDLMKIKEKLTTDEAVKKISQKSTLYKPNSLTSTLAASDITFNKYVPFSEELLAVDKVPLEQLPNLMANFIKEQSLIRGCPQDFILVSLLSRLGVIFAGKVSIQLMRNTEWIVTPNCFWALVGKSSAGKSNALNATKKYLSTLIDIAKNDYRLAYSEYKVQKDSLELQISTFKKALDKLIKSSSTKDIQQKELQISELNRKLINIDQDKPVFKRYIIGKVTIEKLINILQENPEGIMQEIDELGSTFTRLSRDEHAEERGLYLSGFNGNVDYSYDTHKHGNVFIKRVVLSILGGIQPAYLKRFLREALNGKHDDGMLQRFQGIVYPNQYEGIAEDRALSINLDVCMQNIFCKVDQINTNTILKFDNEAQICFDAMREDLTLETRRIAYPMDAHLGKTIEFIGGLCVYLCLFDNKGELPAGNKITLPYVLQAIKLGEYFISHAKRAYGIVYKDNLPARTLSEKIVKMVISATFNKYYDSDTGLYFFTKSDIRTKDWANLTTKEDRREGVSKLIEMGHISEQIEGRYYINPQHLKD